jgi:putative zinc finger protein
MADILCGYTAERDETLIGYLYGEIEASQRAAFEAHTATCERCRKELADLAGVRASLQDWTAPEATRPVVHDPVPSARVVPIRPPAGIWAAIRDIPVWAQAAAAVLVLAASAGMANLDVRYDQRGLSVHTGWSRTVARSTEPQEAALPAIARRADLDALERRLRTEFHGLAPVGAPGGLLKSDASAAASAQLLRQVRALVQDSERRQQNELALRIAEVVHEFDSKRGSDLVNIRRAMREIQSDAGAQQYIINDLRNGVRTLASQTSAPR